MLRVLSRLQYIGKKIFKMTKSIKRTAENTQLRRGDIIPLNRNIVMTEFGFHKSSKQKEIREWLMHDRFRNDLMITANTYSNMSYDKLNELLRQLSNRVNYKMNRYYRKQPNRRIKFICFNEFKDKQEKMLYGKKMMIPANKHSHIIPEIPKEFDTKKVIRLLKTNWRDFNNRKFDLHTTIKKTTDGRWRNVCYASKGFKKSTHNNYYVC